MGKISTKRLFKNELKELVLLKRLVKGTPIKVTLVSEIGKVRISGGLKRFTPIIRQLGITSSGSVGPTSIVKARLSILRKTKKRS